MLNLQTARLSRKALVLISVPLIFEVVFVAVLMQMVLNSERETAQAEKSRMVLVYSENLMRRLYEIGIVTFSMNNIGGQFFSNEHDRATRKVESDLDRLEQVVGTDAEQKKTVAQIKNKVTQILAVLTASKSAIGPDEQDFPLRYESYDFRSELEPLLKDLAPLVRKLTNRERDIRNLRPNAEKNARESVRLFVVIGIVVNIILAVWLAIFFNKSTINRLSVVVDNTEKLATQRPLSARLLGSDEIAQLDNAFHDMAIALERAAQKERAIIDHAIDVICSVDQDGRFLMVSPAAKASWGYEPVDLVGKSIHEVLASKDELRVKSAFRRMKDTASNETLECEVTTAADETRFVAWSANWVPSEASFFCVVRDVTDRKEAERVKREFFQMISHDIRTPLATVEFFLSVLQYGTFGEITPRGLKSAGGATHALQRVLGLVNELLDIEKITAGSFALEIQPAKVSDLLESASKSVRGFAEQKLIAVEAVAKPDGEVNVDADRIVQVIVNLVGNAIKFSPAESRVEIHGQKSADGTLEVRVTDSGRGIPEELRDTIFERFKQVRKEDSANASGSGLGLAICKAIVEAHGGAIGVDSVSTGGSCFWFRIGPQALPESSE